MTITAILAVVAILTIGVIAGSRYIQAQDSSQEIVNKLEPAATSASDLLLSTADMERGVRGYVSTQRAASLAPYAEGSNVSEDAIAQLESLLTSTDGNLEQQVKEVAAARTTWINTVATPTINLVRAGKTPAAETLLDSPESTRSFELLRARATAVNTLIDARLSAQFAEFEQFTQQLGLALALSFLVLLIGVGLVGLLLRRQVLNPLDRLRHQLRAVAGERGYGGDRDMQIVPTGPPEIAQVGKDADDMRRRLVKEIETVDRQRESLDSEGPVVTAIRAELSREPRVYAVGLDVYGELEPSESELAGDWWDAIALPDGRTALIVTDISGHGPQAGIAGLRLKLTITGMLDAGSSLVAAFDRGVRLFADTPGRFATAVGVVIDPRTRSVEWVNAGHLPPLIVTPAGASRSLGITGPLMSTLGGSWTSATTELGDGDLIVMWTDGVTESRDAAGEELEESGLLAFIAAARAAGDTDPQEIVRQVLSAGRDRAVNWGSDDRTLIVGTIVSDH